MSIKQTIRNNKRPFIACTILATNYLPFANVSIKSLRIHNPDWLVYVILLDSTVEECQRLTNKYEDMVKFVTLDDLKCWQCKHMVLRYNVLEFSTAIKPTVFLYLHKLYPESYLFYFDPDIYILNSLKELEKAAYNFDMLLVPHTFKPVEDDFSLSIMGIQHAGIYNLGFIGLNLNNKSVMESVCWWQDKLEYECIHDISRGYFVDQRWANFFPGFVSNCHVLRHPGYNIAFYNLHERICSLDPTGKLVVNGLPAYWFHFSAYDPYNPRIISKHQNRYLFIQNYALYSLSKEYAEKVIQHEYKHYCNIQYKFNYLPDGTQLTASFRLWYKHLGRGALSFGDEPEIYPVVQEKAKSFAHGSNSSDSNIYNIVLHEITPNDSLLKRYIKSNLNYTIITLYNIKYGIRSKEFRQSVKAHIRYNLLSSFKLIKKILNKKRIESLQLSRISGKSIVSHNNKLITNDGRQKEAEVNIFGYLSSVLGIGDSARGIIKGFDEVNISTNLFDFTLNPSKKINNQFTSRCIKRGYAPISLICINADQVHRFFQSNYGDVAAESRYKVGYWYWELGNFPRCFWPQQFSFNEIWTATNFVHDSLDNVLDIPVYIIPPVISVPDNIIASRKEFALNKEKTLFLMMFDGFSYMERKNPLAVIDAFKFFIDNYNAKDVELVIKSINLNIADRKLLNEKIKNYPIRLIFGYYDIDKLYRLMKCCDCYVSLHRSEGLGIPLVEAMQLGKPVIATGYSGNMDFMNSDNSFLVEYELSEIKKDYGPYLAGNFWAEPSIASTAESMSRVYKKDRTVDEISLCGQRVTREFFNALRVSSLLKKRIQIIQNTM